MQIPGVYSMGIGGIVSLQDNILTRFRIALGYSFSSRICDFLSPGDLLSAGSPAWLALCAVPASWAGSIYQLSCSLRLPWQFLQLCSSSFQVPLPLWVPSASVYWFAWKVLAPHRTDQIFKNLSWFPAVKHGPSSSLNSHYSCRSSCLFFYFFTSKALHVVPAFLHKLSNHNLIVGLGGFCLAVLIWWF